MSKRVRDPTTGLTPLEEMFCVCLAQGMSRSGAYRLVFPRSATWKAAAVHVRASQLAAGAKVQLRVADLQSDLRERSGHDLMQAMRESSAALQLAFEQRNPAAAISVVALRARMNGLLVEDRRNSRRPYQHLSDEELQAAIDQAQREIDGGLQ